MREPGDIPPDNLFTFRTAGWTLVLAALLVGILFWQVSAHLARSERIGDGENLASYRFDLSTTLVPEEKLVPARAREFVKALDEPGSITIEEMTESPDRWLRKLLVPSDRVIGVRVGGEARAYPLRVLNWHEVVNDVLGGTPIAVTYCPLTDGAVVFDRRVAGETLLLRASGILYESGQLLFEKRPEIGTESLWCQLEARAIAGPAAARGEKLTRLPFRLTEWGAWSGQYPDTTLVAPDPQFYKHYPRRPYASYFGTREPRYPVDGYPPPGDRDPWTPVVLVPSGDDLEVVPGPVQMDILAHALWWAWSTLGH